MKPKLPVNTILGNISGGEHATSTWDLQRANNLPPLMLAVFKALIIRKGFISLYAFLSIFSHKGPSTAFHSHKKKAIFCLLRMPFKYLKITVIFPRIYASLI